MFKPVFTISAEAATYIGQIAEKLGKMRAQGDFVRNLHLRKANRLRSVQASAAIEGNSLSVEQVTDIINGKAVLGNPREIQEIRNAYGAYEKMLELDPFSIQDFLWAHKIMTGDLLDQAGKFRSGDVGVFKGKDMVHMGARPQFVPGLMADLLGWAKNAPFHPLIISSVVHFEIEIIHPFADGNGRMGRLWQSLLLSRWAEMLAWLPVETMIHKNQQKYYDVLGRAGKKQDCAEFIELMLALVRAALDEVQQEDITDIYPDIITDNLSKGEEEFLRAVGGHLQRQGEIDNYQAQKLCGKSAESVKKYFAALVSKGALKAVGSNKGRKYILAKEAGA